MSDLNILFCPEDLLAHKKKPSQLPQCGGPKAFAPDDGSSPDQTLASLMREKRDILQEQRVSKKGNLSVGTWNPDEQVVEISVSKGPYWQHFGQRKHGKMQLQPQEALFLLEQGSLELYYGGLPMSFQQAYMSMLSDDFSPDHYLVYTYFLRLGFTVLLHSSSRQNSEEDPIAESKPHQKTEKNEEITTGAVTDDDDVIVSFHDDNIPNISSPVAHLWMSKDDIRPLVQPDDATSTAAVLSKLQVIKNQRMTEGDCMELSSAQQSLQIVLDVYQPGLNFKKTDPGPPDFCITVCRFCDPPPSLAALTVLRKECCPVPLKIALVDGGSVSFYSVLDVDSPTFITRDLLSVIAKRKTNYECIKFWLDASYCLVELGGRSSCGRLIALTLRNACQKRMAKFQASYRPCVELEIKVLRGRDIKLASPQFWDKPDPYVKLLIPTAPNGSRQTTVKYDTTNPIWNEVFQFYLDPVVQNHLEITLVECDKYTEDDGLETKTFDVSGLERNESYQHTFTFSQAFQDSKVDVEMRATDCTAPSDLRYSIELCDREKAFLQKRKKIVLEAMKNYLGERGPNTLSEVPNLVILGSGGGFRAMVYLSGVFCALKDMGLFDCCTYTSGLSGSAWFLSMLYSHPEWPEIHPQVLKNEMRDIFEDNWMMKLLFSPSWLINHLNIIQGKKQRGQPVTFTDFYGYLIGDVLRRKRKDVPKLSDQQRVVKDAFVPFPLYNCVHVKTDVPAKEFGEWVEFTPYEIGMAKYGTFMKTEQFGNKFFCGKLVCSYKEPPIHFLEGLYGSAYTFVVQRRLASGKKPATLEDQIRITGEILQDLHNGGTIDSNDILSVDAEGSDNEEVQEDDVRAKQQLVEQEPEEDDSFVKFLKFLAEKFPILKTREGRAGLIHNFLRGLQLPSAPVPSGPDEDTADQYSVRSKRVFLIDSGLVFGSPYPMFLRTPQRAVDIFLSFETSDRGSDDNPPFKELLLAEEWAKKNDVKFPPIDAEEQFKKYGMKELYVFRHPIDPSCPIVMHFVMVNLTFRQESAPGVQRQTEEEKKFADFKILDDPDNSYSTSCFKYPKLQFDRLSDLGYFNTLLGEDAIKDVMAECVEKLRALRHKAVRQ